MQSLPLFLLLASPALFAGSVRIINDSPYPLKAEIRSAEGRGRGSVHVEPHQQGNWVDNNVENTVWSQTPYTVVLTCKDGKQFGVIENVQQGATITTLSARGSLHCAVDDKKTPSFPSPETYHEYEMEE